MGPTAYGIIRKGPRAPFLDPYERCQQDGPDLVCRTSAVMIGKGYIHPLCKDRTTYSVYATSTMPIAEPAIAYPNG